MLNGTIHTFLKYFDTICDYNICSDGTLYFKNPHIYSYIRKIADKNAAIDTMTRYRSMSHIYDKLSKYNGDIYVYYTINDKLFLEYGFIYGRKKIIYDKLKINKRNYKFINSIGYKVIEPFKNITKLRFEDFLILSDIKLDMHFFDLDDINVNDKSIKINNNMIEYYIKLKNINHGMNIKNYVKNEFNVWVVDKKWVDKILYKIDVADDDIRLIIKLKSV